MTKNRRVSELLAEYGQDGLSVAWALCDRHPPEATAVTVVGPGTSTDLTYGELRDRSQRLAAGLAGLGVGAGSRVAVLLPKGEELVVTLLAIWRLGAVHVPLFTAFAPGAIASRLQASGAVVVVCDAQQRPKLDPGADLKADPARRVITVGTARPGDIAFGSAADGHGRFETPAAQGPDGAFIQIYTSGTTGTPKGVVVPARALASFVAYLGFGLDVRPDDVYWNAADPGWAYGLYYAVVAPLAAGRRTLLATENFSPGTFWRVLTGMAVTNVAAAPTVYRALRGSGLAASDAVKLRAASSAGEPLTPDIVEWADDALGVAVLDHYGQTELGMVAINGHHPSVRAEVRPGSMGRAMPGFSLAILNRDRDEIARHGTVGRVAVDVAASPLLWFTGYEGNPAKAADRFTSDGRYYVTGDSGAMDTDGYVSFSGRDDDVIIMAGYRISPVEIEAVLSTHDRVVECAVVGVPDQVRGEVAEAFVVLAPEGPPGDTTLAAELQDLVRTRYAAHAYPRQVHFVDALPKTPSGKIQRFMLRRTRGRALAGSGPT